MKRKIILLAGLSIFCGVFSSSNYAYDRIISLGGTLTEIVFALGQGNKVVAVDASSLYPKKVSKIKKLGYRQNISLEGVVSLKPDLILASSKMVPKSLLDSFRKLKLNVFVVKEEDSLSGAKEKIQEVAKILKEDKKGKILVQVIEDGLQKLKKIKKEKKLKKKVLFIYARGGHRVYMAGSETPANKMIEMAGVQNAFSKVKGFKPITTEALIMSDPDIIVMLKGGADSLDKGPWSIKGVKQTKAGKEKNLILVDDLAFLGFGPRCVDSLLGFIEDIEKLQ